MGLAGLVTSAFGKTDLEKVGLNLMSRSMMIACTHLDAEN